MGKEAEADDRGRHREQHEAVGQPAAVLVVVAPRTGPRPEERRRREQPRQEIAGRSLEGTLGRDRVRGVEDVAPEQPVREVARATGGRERDPRGEDRQREAGGECEDTRGTGRLERIARTGTYGGPGEREKPQCGDGASRAWRGRAAGLPGSSGPDRAARRSSAATAIAQAAGSSITSSALGGEHVVGEERRAVDQPQHRRRHAAPIVAERGGGGERGQRDAQHGREQVHREQAPTEEELRQRVVAVQERRLVVDEVGVEPAAVEQHPRPHRVGGLVHVQDLDDQREPARQQARHHEQAE